MMSVEETAYVIKALKRAFVLGGIWGQEMDRLPKTSIKAQQDFNEMLEDVCDTLLGENSGRM